MKWYFNKRLVHTRANGSKNNMFLFQQNWIKDIVVNINRIGIKKMLVLYRRRWGALERNCLVYVED